MNYRHNFHAGNHADVLKHAVLARIVAYLAQKDKPFCFLDVHAGTGVYDLQSAAAEKTGEWAGGVGLLSKPFPAEMEAILQPFRGAVATLNPSGGLRYYPGSPEMALQNMRTHDHLIANELHPQDATLLRASYLGEPRVRVTQVDAAISIKANLPFAERRGLVLIDPPYEAKDEFQKVARMLAQGKQRFESGVFLVWYPVITEESVSSFLAGITHTGIKNILKAEMRIKLTHASSGLSGSGLLIVNPPYILESELKTLLPALAERLGINGLGRYEVAWLTPPQN